MKSGLNAPCRTKKTLHAQTNFMSNTTPSRSKKKRENDSPEPEISATEETSPAPEGVISEPIDVPESAEAVEADETASTPPASDPTETIPEESEKLDEISRLPDSVPEGTLSGDVPQGEVPRLHHVIEAILFASQKAVTPKELATHLKSAATAEPTSVAAAFAGIKERDIHEALEELQAEVAASGRAYQVRETATGWLLSSAAGFAPWLRALYPEAKPTRLSAPALETLAIIAYRQPIARADMEAVRGVAVDGVMQTLLDRGLVKIAGRAEVAGRPLLYATTQYFLDHFGLKNLDELPNAAELCHIPLPKAVVASEPAAKVALDDGTPELPGVAESPEESSPAVEPIEVVEIDDLIEVRESVVFEEISFEAVESLEISEAAESSESDSDFGERPPVT